MNYLLNIHTFDNHNDLGIVAAAKAGEYIDAAIQSSGVARVILAAAPSQLPVLTHLAKKPIDFSKVEFFHMDDYIGLSHEAPQGFANWLDMNFFSKLPCEPIFHRIDTITDPEEDARSYHKTMGYDPFDLTLCGLGINAHIAFNDPGSSFSDPQGARYIALAWASRQQQVSEGHFPNLEAVPQHAVTVTIPRLLNTKHIICSVLGKEKLQAVSDVLSHEPTEDIPGTALKTHRDVHLYLDSEATPTSYIGNRQ